MAILLGDGNKESLTIGIGQTSHRSSKCAYQSLLWLRELLRELTLIFDPELTDADLLALFQGGGEREREMSMGDLLLDERAGLRPRGGEGLYSRGEGKRDTSLSLRRVGEIDLFQGGKEALSLSQSAQER